MTFNSLGFLLFFTVVLAVDLLLRHQGRGRKPFLLIASWFFYACWDWRFLALILFSTGLDFLVGTKIHGTENPKRRRAWLYASLVGNLGILGTFKYYDFFAESLAEWTGANLPLLDIALPIGISFYTFQTLSYTLDIYRKELTPTKSFSDFALFVAFFPQLVAGPIVRAKEFLPQLRPGVSRPNSSKIQEGLSDILIGLFKKVVIADTIGRGIGDPFFANPDAYGTLGAICAIYAVAFQFYGDFDGYSRIAIGCGKMLGFELPENFRSPFTSRTMIDLLRRWHITLSTWMRDYLYFPLGGNRCSPKRALFNVAATMFLVGLWHGAGWNFPIWGLLLGLGLMVSHLRENARKANGVQLSNSPIAILFQRACVFNYWCLVGVFFRAPTFPEAIDVFSSLLRGLSGHFEPLHAFLTTLCLAWFCISARPDQWVGEKLNRLSPEFQGAILVLLLGFIAAVQTSATPFIYFQF